MIRKALYEHEMLDNSSLAVALSGGKDSLTLLFMLKAILGRGFPKLELIAIHVSGAFSCGPGLQTNYLEEICRALSIPLIVRGSTQELSKLSCYPCSQERRRLIFTAAKEAGCTTIAFGHHRDDNAQTLLLNLLHKGECAGILPKLAMVDFGITLIRPLILVSEEEITHFAKEQGFARISCQCPIGQNSMRKKVDRLIEEMELLFPNVRTNLSMAALNYGSDKAQRKKEPLAYAPT